ncbi:MAG: hypothetical protein ACRDT4_01545 [Micromonosporaceae bacterium]
MNAPNVERVFGPSDVVAVPDVAGDHVLVLRSGSTPELAVTGGAGPRQAIAVAESSGIEAVLIARSTEDAVGRGRALAFASWLRHVRTRRGLAWCCVSAATRPEVDEDAFVRLPHLVATTDGTTVADVVIWEVLRTDRAERWLGRPLPARGFEDRLDGLLTLRRRARDGTLGPAAGRRLGRVLADRYLSIRLVYEHPDLFDDLTRETNGAE